MSLSRLIFTFSIEKFIFTPHIFIKYYNLHILFKILHKPPIVYCVFLKKNKSKRRVLLDFGQTTQDL